MIGVQVTPIKSNPVVVTTDESTTGDKNTREDVTNPVIDLVNSEDEDDELVVLAQQSGKRFKIDGPDGPIKIIAPTIRLNQNKVTGINFEHEYNAILDMTCGNMTERFSYKNVPFKKLYQLSCRYRFH